MNYLTYIKIVNKINLFKKIIIPERERLELSLSVFKTVALPLDDHSTNKLRA